MKKVALLTTGDEVVNGDITNTNAQYFANQLFNHQIFVGNHLSVSDEEHDLLQGLEFLLTHHDVVITTGGLGPTSDDRTRYAMAKALGCELQFDQASWQAIVDLIGKRYGRTDIPENNKQQAMFPADALIFPNPIGSARGALCQVGEKVVIMLPGPPRECVPMFHDHVLPHLIEYGFQQSGCRKRWMLFGIGEGLIAGQLDEAVKDLAGVVGYRLAYPYIEFKIFADTEDELAALEKACIPTIKPLIIGDGQSRASEQLRAIFIEKQLSFCIDDSATGGALIQLLQTPDTYSLISENASWEIQCRGLEAYWKQQGDAKTALLQIIIKHDNAIVSDETTEVYLRREITVGHAAELACIECLKHINPNIS